MKLFAQQLRNTASRGRIPWRLYLVIFFDLKGFYSIEYVCAIQASLLIPESVLFRKYRTW